SGERSRVRDRTNAPLARKADRVRRLVAFPEAHRAFFQSLRGKRHRFCVQSRSPDSVRATGGIRAPRRPNPSHRRPRTGLARRARGSEKREELPAFPQQLLLAGKPRLDEVRLTWIPRMNSNRRFLNMPGHNWGLSQALADKGRWPCPHYLACVWRQRTGPAD